MSQEECTGPTQHARTATLRIPGSMESPVVRRQLLSVKLHPLLDLFPQFVNLHRLGHPVNRSYAVPAQRHMPAKKPYSSPDDQVAQRPGFVIKQKVLYMTDAAVDGADRIALHFPRAPEMRVARACTDRPPLLQLE